MKSLLLARENGVNVAEILRRRKCSLIKSDGCDNDPEHQIDTILAGIFKYFIKHSVFSNNSVNVFCLSAYNKWK